MPRYLPADPYDGDADPYDCELAGAQPQERRAIAQLAAHHTRPPEAGIPLRPPANVSEDLPEPLDGHVELDRTLDGQGQDS